MERGKGVEKECAKRLASNAELSLYLTELAEKMTARGRGDIAAILTSASTQWRVVPATEFLGESRLALQSMLRDDSGFTDDERQQVTDVLRQLDAAFDHRG